MAKTGRRRARAGRGISPKRAAAAALFGRAARRGARIFSKPRRLAHCDADAAMSERSTSPSLPRPTASRWPRSQTVCRGSVPLVIEPLLPDCTHRPMAVASPLLERFADLMAERGWPVQLSRMAFDRIYARERCTWARRHGWGELRWLAVQLSTGYLLFTDTRRKA